MAEVTIELVPENPSYTFEVGLQGATYLFTVRWNDRDGAWFLHVADLVGEPIATGLKLVASWPLLRFITTQRRPPGELYCMDTTGLGAEPGFSDLGRRHQLVYVEG